MSKPRIKLKGAMPARAQAYEGAGHGRRAGGWNAPASGPNKALNGALKTIRNRAHAAYRNNPWLRRAIEGNVTNETGCGITPVFASNDDLFNEVAAAQWNVFTGQASADGSLDFYGQLTQEVRARRVAGEVFIRRRNRPTNWGLVVPFQLQVIEANHVPETLNKKLPNGNKIIAGKEYNAAGQLVAVHMHAEHPEEDGADMFGALLRVPARDIIHHYLPLRPGQVRGEPDVVSALLRAHTYDSYEDAELVRKQTRAPFTGFLQKEYQSESDWAYDPITGEQIEGGEMLPEINAQPGTILTGAHGESLTLFDGDNTGRGYDQFQKQQMLAMAAGANSLYELMSGDWTGINDRVYRAMINEYRRGIEMLQDHLCIHQICERVGFWFTDAGVLSGALPASDYYTNYDNYNSREWRPHRWPHIHPTQDVDATVKEIENDLTSLDAEVAKRGWLAKNIQQQNVTARQRKQDMEATAGLTENDNTGDSA